MTKADLQAENTALKEQNAYLYFQLKKLENMIFGVKSERHISLDNTDQLQLNFAGLEEALVVASQKSSVKSHDRSQSKAHPGRQELPTNLPVDQEIIEPEEDTSDAKLIGQEVTRTLEYLPGSLRVKETVRNKYKLPDGRVVIAPLPDRPLPKSIAEASLLAYVLVSKFVVHLPFQRIRELFKREYGYEVSKGTMNSWYMSVGRLLWPLYQALIQLIKQSDYLQIDESRIKVQDSEKLRALHQGYQWVYFDPIRGLVCFHYNKGRGGYAPRKFIDKDFQGFIQTDGYSAYNQFKAYEGIILLACMAHARRKFVEAKKNDRKRADQALAYFKELYAIEAELSDGVYEPHEITIVRQIYAKAILDELETWLDEQVGNVISKSAIGQAINYTRKLWPRLIGYIQDPRLKIDNNLIENEFRALALGRKNYLFAGSHKSAEYIGMFYSFFATCKHHGIDPQIWLKDVLDKIPSWKVNQLQQLLPHNWKNTVEV